MPVGDILEWLAAALLVTAAYLWSGLVLALGVAGFCLAYEAQCLASTRLALPSRRPKVSALDGKAIWRCDRCGGEHWLGLQAGHVCQDAA